MQKIFRCPGCGNSMEFFPETQKMYCIYCGSTYSVEELNEQTSSASDQKLPEPSPYLGESQPSGGAQSSGGSQSGEENRSGGGTQNSGGLQWAQGVDPSWPFLSQEPSAEDGREQAKEKIKEKEKMRRHATIQMQILHCNSCGAELAVNGVEASSFCAYCGQATVVMDRVEDYLQPDYIMPFRITKDQAESIIRNRISAGYFIPDGIKNFEVEKLRGIYIPFWLFDMYYGDDQYWKYTVKRGKSSVTRYCHRLGDCHFHRMTLDASKNFNDDSSQRLEPYDMNDLREFDPAYLSGFYSDRFDVGTDDLEGLAFRRAKELFDENVKSTIHHGGAKMVHTSPVSQVTKREYALLPVWFLTFRYENMPYTILVNGQTGKMVGAVPYVKKKAYAVFGILAAIFCLIFAMIGAYLTPAVLYHSDEGKTIGYYFALIGLAIFSTWSVAIAKYKAMLVSIGLTRSGTTSRFVRERQDRDR